ncbi:hypothetical protein M9434_003297 [Picochlorum sp. BPE23]|nr:hypothetical protein M9434_003297 [Picochlorum sp. BPE23]
MPFRHTSGAKEGTTVDGNSSWKQDSDNTMRAHVSHSALSTSTDWNYIAEATATTGEDLVEIPQWNIRVNGRVFSHYLGISKRTPRKSIFLLPVIDPASRLATFWGYTNTITDMTYTSFIVPLSMAFNDYSRVNAWSIMDLIGSCIYIIDLLMQFHIGFMVRWDMEHVTITDGIAVAKRYILNGTFAIDFLASLPIILQVMFMADSDLDENQSAVRLIQLIRLLRLLRVVNLIMRMGQVTEGGSMSFYFASKFSTLSLFIIRIVFTLSVLVNLMASLWWWIAATEGFENSWVEPVDQAKPDLNLDTTNNLNRWLVCAYFVLCTVSTIGYGDITPVSIAEICLNILFILIGVAYFGYVISSISQLLAMSKSSSIDGGQLLEKLRGMEVWMKKNGFKKKTREELRRFYYTTWSPARDESDIEYFDELPLWLRSKVIKSMIGNSRALENFTGIKMHPESKIAKQVIKAVAASAVPLHFRSAEKVFKRGEEANYVYLLEEGEVGAIIVGDKIPYSIRSPGVFGSAAVFSSKIEVCSQRSLTVFTITSCTVWRVDGQDLFARLLSNAPISLVHILEHFLDGLGDLREYVLERSQDDDVMIDEGHLRDVSSQILEEGAELKEALANTSRRAFEKDIARGEVELGDVDHRSFYHILHEDDAGPETELHINVENLNNDEHNESDDEGEEPRGGNALNRKAAVVKNWLQKMPLVSMGRNEFFDDESDDDVGFKRSIM